MMGSVPAAMQAMVDQSGRVLREQCAQGHLVQALTACGAGLLAGGALKG